MNTYARSRLLRAREGVWLWDEEAAKYLRRARGIRGEHARLRRTQVHEALAARINSGVIQYVHLWRIPDRRRRPIASPETPASTSVLLQLAARANECAIR